MEDKSDVDKQQKSNIGGCTGKGWKPGQSGNPKGRPPNELSITNLMRQKLDDVPTELLGKPYTGGKTWLELIAEAALTAAAFGQSAYTKELLDRLEGRVPLPHDIGAKEPLKFYVVYEEDPQPEGRE